MLHKVGALDKTTMRDFDARHLVAPSMMAPAQIKQLRETNNVSQPVFARYLNTSESTVEKWETGAKRPSGIALKLLTIVAIYGLQILTGRAMAISVKDDDSSRRHKQAV